MSICAPIADNSGRVAEVLDVSSMLSIDADQQRLLNKYCDLLLRWNKRYNLIGRNQTDCLKSRHILDSLMFATHLHGSHIVDLGSGAGLPGIPLAIVSPELHFDLIESRQRKAAFLRQAVIDLKLPNVDVCSIRAEQYAPKHSVGTVVSRGFGTLKSQLQCTRQWWSEDTHLVSLRGLQEDSAVPKGYDVQRCKAKESRMFYIVRRRSA